MNNGKAVKFFLLVIILFSCQLNPKEKDVRDREVSQGRVSRHCNTLIDNGEDIFNEVFDSYGLGNSPFVDDIKAHVDFTIFPEGYSNSSHSNFWNRMESYYYEDNVYDKVKELIENDDNEEDKDGDGVYLFGIKQLESRMNEGSRNPGSRYCYYCYNWGYCNYYCYYRYHVCYRISSSSRRLRRIESSIGAMRSEMASYYRDLKNDIAQLRKEIGEINEKIDTVIEELHDLKNDINTMGEQITEIGDILTKKNLNTPLNAIKGFLRDYGRLAVSDAEEREIALKYKDEFERILLDFMDAILDMQSWAKAQSSGEAYYPDMVYDEEKANVLKVYVRWQTVPAGWTGRTEYPFDFKNPRKNLNISLGNLEYLAKMIMTRFIMNQALYSGDELTLANSKAATLYLEDIRHERFNIKTSLAEAIKLMDAEYINHMDMINSNFKPFTDAGFSGLYLVADGETVDAGKDTTDFRETLLQEVYASVYSDYIGNFLAEMIALETDLEAYVVDDLGEEAEE